MKTRLLLLVFLVAPVAAVAQGWAGFRLARRLRTFAMCFHGSLRSVTFLPAATTAIAPVSLWRQCRALPAITR